MALQLKNTYYIDGRCNIKELFQFTSNLYGFFSNFFCGEIMPTLELIEKKRDEIKRISSKHGVRHIRIFGSVAKQTAGPDSDVDFLVELDKDRSLLDLGGLLMDLQDLLGCKVDVVTEKGLHWFLKDKILKEAKML